MQAGKDAEDDDDEIDPTKYYESRCKLIATMKASGQDPYPHKFSVGTSIFHFTKDFAALKQGEDSEVATVSVAGRIYSKRMKSKKLTFYDLHGEGTKIQVIMEFGHYEDEADPVNKPAYHAINDLLRRGDIVGVVGRPTRSKTGEISIWPTSVKLLTPCLRVLPTAQYGFKDKEQVPHPHVHFH